MLNRRVFFADIRQSLFRGTLSQTQVDGLNHLLDVWCAHHRARDPRWLAYCLATAYHETAHTLEPLSEYGRGRGRPYGKRDPESGLVYYGRGLVQLTWAANYRAMGRKLGLDLYRNPELANDPAIAAQILYSGMIDGDFTGKKLADYIDGNRANFRGARRIVNGTDRAGLIAGYAVAFAQALAAARGAAPSAEGEAIDAPVTGKPLPTSTTGIAALVQFLVTVIVSLAAGIGEVIAAVGPWGAAALIIAALAAVAWIYRERWLKKMRHGV